MNTDLILFIVSALLLLVGLLLAVVPMRSSAQLDSGGSGLPVPASGQRDHGSPIAPPAPCSARPSPSETTVSSPVAAEGAARARYHLARLGTSRTWCGLALERVEGWTVLERGADCDGCKATHTALSATSGPRGAA